MGNLFRTGSFKRKSPKIENSPKSPKKTYTESPRSTPKARKKQSLETPEAFTRFGSEPPSTSTPPKSPKGFLRGLKRSSSRGSDRKKSKDSGDVQSETSSIVSLPVPIQPSEEPMDTSPSPTKVSANGNAAKSDDSTKSPISPPRVSEIKEAPPRIASVGSVTSANRNSSCFKESTIDSLFGSNNNLFDSAEMDAFFGSKKEKTPERVLDEKNITPVKKSEKGKTPETIPEEKKSPLIGVGARSGVGVNGTRCLKKDVANREEKKSVSNIRARMQMYESKYKSGSVEVEKKEEEKEAPVVKMEVETPTEEPETSGSKLEAATTIKKGSLLFEDEGEDDLFGRSKGKKEVDKKDTSSVAAKKASLFDDQLFLDKDDGKKPKESESTSRAKEEAVKTDETEKKESPKRTPLTWEKDTLSTATRTSQGKEEKTTKEEEIPDWKKRLQEKRRKRAEAASSATETRVTSPKPTTETAKTEAKEEEISDWQKRKLKAEAASSATEKRGTSPKPATEKRVVTSPKPSTESKTEAEEEEISDWQKRKLKAEAASSATEKRGTSPKPATEKRVVTSPKPSTESKTEAEEEELPDWQKRVRERRKLRAEAASSAIEKRGTSPKPAVKSTKTEVESKPKKKSIFDDEKEDEPFVPSFRKTVTSPKPDPTVASPEPEKSVSSPEPVASPKPEKPVTSPKSETPITSPIPEKPVSSPEPMEVTSQESKMKKLEDTKKKERTNLFGEPLDTEVKVEVEIQPNTKSIFDEDEPYIPFRLKRRGGKKTAQDSLFADVETEPKKMDTSEAVSPKASEEVSLFSSEICSRKETKLFADDDEEPYVPFGLRRKVQKGAVQKESLFSDVGSKDTGKKLFEDVDTSEVIADPLGVSVSDKTSVEIESEQREKEKKISKEEKAAKSEDEDLFGDDKKDIESQETEASKMETESQQETPKKDVQTPTPEVKVTSPPPPAPSDEPEKEVTDSVKKEERKTEGKKSPLSSRRRAGEKESPRTTRSARIDSKLSKTSTDRKSKKDEGTKPSWMSDVQKRRDGKKDEKKDEKTKVSPSSSRSGTSTPTSQRKEKKDGKEEEMPDWQKRVLERRKKKAEAGSSATGTKSPRLGQKSPNSSSATRSPSTGRRAYGSKNTVSEKTSSPSTSRSKNTRSSDLSKSVEVGSSSRIRDREKKEEKEKALTSNTKEESSPSKKSDVASPTRPKPKVAKKPSIEVITRKSLSSTSSDKKSSISEESKAPKSPDVSVKKEGTALKTEAEDEVFLSNEKSATANTKGKETELALKRTPSPKLSIELISTVLEPPSGKTEKDVQQEDSTDSGEKKDKKAMEKEDDSKKPEEESKKKSEEEMVTAPNKRPMSPSSPPVEKASQESSRQSSVSSDHEDTESRPYRSFSHSRSPTPTSSTGPLKIDNSAVPEWKKKLKDKKKSGNSASSSPARRPRAVTTAKEKEAELPAWKKELLAKKKAVTGDVKVRQYLS